ncbi:MAG: hypothetical protein D6785_02610, partial [Planctomycetota bacterium]
LYNVSGTFYYLKNKKILFRFSTSATFQNEVLRFRFPYFGKKTGVTKKMQKLFKEVPKLKPAKPGIDSAKKSSLGASKKKIRPAVLPKHPIRPLYKNYVIASYRANPFFSTLSGGWHLKSGKLSGKGVWRRQPKVLPKFAGQWYVKGVLNDQKKTPYSGKVLVKKLGRNLYSLQGALSLRRNGQYFTFGRINNKGNVKNGQLHFDFTVSSSMIFHFYPYIRFIRQPANPIASAVLTPKGRLLAFQWKTKTFSKISGQGTWTPTPQVIHPPRPIPLPTPIQIVKSYLTLQPKSFWVNMMPGPGPIKRTKKVNLALQYTVVNPSSTQPIKLTFMSGQTYEVLIQSSGRTVYRWSKGRAFTKNIWTKTLKPGEKWTMSLNIPLTIGPGTPFSAGKYQVKMYLTTKVKSLAHASFQIQYAY